VKPRTAEIAALAALLLFVAGRCLVPMDETDMFFNLRLGEIVLGGHRVPRTNLLSFTFPDVRDVNLAWLFQILLALAHRAGGVAGTVVLKTAFVLATFALLYRVALRRGAHPAAAAAALALAAWAAEPRFVERPHLVTFLGLAFMLLAIDRAEVGRPRTLLALVPLGLLWANANSCFFLAPGVLALYAAGAALESRRADARRAALVAAALLPLIFATPSGVYALGYIANHWRMPALRPLQEYRTAGWPVDGPFFFVAAGVALAVALPSRRIRHLLPVVLLGFVGARRIRFVAEFALLSGPLLAAALTELAARVGRRVRIPDLTVTVAVVATLAGFTLVPRFDTARAGGRFADLGIEADLIPFAAVDYADRNGLRDRMYNDLEVGSYLTWQGWPRHPVFQDPRINGYPADFHAVLRRDDLSRAEWESLLSRHDVRSALVTYPGVNPRAALFDPARWALVYRAPDGLVFARRRPEHAALIARDEHPLSFEFSRASGVTPRVLATPPPGSPLPRCEWYRRSADVLVELGDDAAALAAYQAARAAPGCLDEHARRAAGLALGDVALRLHQPAIAVEAYSAIEDPRAHLHRALALIALDRPAEALIDLAAARAANPNDPATQQAEAIARERLRR
jgi:hypothetical protein